MEWINSLKSFWEVVKPAGAIMVAGLMLIGGGLASKKFLQLDLQNWQVMTLILLGFFVLLYGFYKGVSAAKRNKLNIRQEDDVLIVKSAKADAASSQIKIRLDNIENERCSIDKVVGLPVNSEFQDDCIKRKNSSAGAYIDACLGGDVATRYGEILHLFDDVCKRIGATKLVRNFLDKGDNIVFVAVTEKDGQGIITTTPTNISYASQELVRVARAHQFLEVSCPVFGSGHGGIASKVAMRAMIDGILSAFEAFGCNNMTVTIKVHRKTFSDIKDVKKVLEIE